MDSIQKSIINYRSLRAINSSLIRECLKSEIHGYYCLTGPSKEQTDAMLLGSYVHALATVGKEDYCIAPECDRRTKEGKAVYKEFEDHVATLENKIVISHKLAKDGERITQAIRDSSEAQAALSGCEFEQAIYFKVHEHGCKALLDGVKPNVIVDIKTTSAELDDASIARTIYYSDYHTQMAYYVQACLLTRRPIEKVLMIFVSTGTPTLCRVIELSQDFLSLGLQRCEQGFPIAAKLMDGYIPQQPTGVTVINPPFTRKE